MRILALIFGLVLSAAAGWWAGGLLVNYQATARIAPVYDHQVAYHLASLGVPANTEEYFMFDLNSGSDAGKQASEMAGAFATAHAEGKSLGVIGDDPAHNRIVLKKAVAQSQGKQYPQMTLIVVGPRAQREAMQAAVTPIGAQFKYFDYP